MKSTRILPYVYVCTNKLTSEFYIGYRSANTVPSSEDLGILYFTSSDAVKSSFANFTYTIVAEFFTPADAYAHEQQLIHENLGHPKLLNKSCFYGQKPFFSSTPETRKKIGAKSKGRPTGMKNIPRSDIVKDKIRQGVLKTLDTRPEYKPSAAGLSKIAESTKSMWASAPMLTCPHCGKESKNKGNMNRYHFDNCKINIL